MNLLCFLTDQDFDNKLLTPDRSGYRIRHAGRAVVSNKNGEVALIKVGKYGIYKLPGGGVESYEDIHEGLKREIFEETGCRASIGDEIGITLEFRDEWKMLQISYCYKAHIVEDLGKFNLDEYEKDDEFSLEWVLADKAIPLMESHVSPEYDPKFMQRRDLVILRAIL